MSQEVSTVSQNARAPVDDGAFKKSSLQSTTTFHQRMRFADGRYSVNDIPEPAGKEYLGVTVTPVGRGWPEDGPPETCAPEDIDRLNSHFLESEKPRDLNGNPTDYWKHYYDLGLVDLHTATSYVLSSPSMGMKIAAENLISQVQNMRRIRGANVLPVITLSSVLMRTRFGQKARPSFNVVRWVGDEGPVKVGWSGGGEMGLKPVKEPTAGEIVNGSIPDHPKPKAKPKSADAAPWDDDIDF